MRLSNLIAELQFLAQDGEDPEVEVATGPHTDEWYQAVLVSYELNFKGNFVVVIKAD